MTNNHSEEDFIPDRHHVEHGYKVMMKAYQGWLNAKIKKGGDVKFASTMMIAHNFHKTLLLDIARRTQMNDDMKKLFFAEAIQQFANSLLEPLGIDVEVEEETDDGLSTT